MGKWGPKIFVSFFNEQYCGKRKLFKKKRQTKKYSPRYTPSRLDIMSTWTISEVCDHFKELGANEEEIILIGQEQINGRILYKLTSRDLKKLLFLPIGICYKHMEWKFTCAEK